MMVFPHVWDWCLHWRERHRCFYPKWEIDLLFICRSQLPSRNRLAPEIP